MDPKGGVTFTGSRTQPSSTVSSPALETRLPLAASSSRPNSAISSPALDKGGASISSSSRGGSTNVSPDGRAPLADATNGYGVDGIKNNLSSSSVGKGGVRSGGHNAKRKERLLTRDEEALLFLKSISMGGESSGETNDGNQRTKSLTQIDLVRQASSMTFDGDNNSQFFEDDDDENVDPNVLRCQGSRSFAYVTLKNLMKKSDLPKWEHSLLSRGVMGGRWYFAGTRSYPVGVMSMIEYKVDSSEVEGPAGVPKLTGDASTLAVTVTDSNKYGVSYAPFLHATWADCDQERDELEGHYCPEVEPYDFEHFDDPAMKQGKHRTVMPLSGYIQSVLPFVTVDEIKNEINSQFREKNPWINPGVSLSKIRTLKAVAVDQWHELDLEMATLAFAFSYFERLCHKDLITKPNRKLYFTICVLLAFKFNEPPGRPRTGGGLSTSTAPDIGRGSYEGGTFFQYNENERQHSTPLRKILEMLAITMSVTVKDILDNEMKVYVALDFALHLQIDEIYFHFFQILKRLQTTTREYLGDKDYEFHRYISVLNRAGLGILKPTVAVGDSILINTDLDSLIEDGLENVDENGEELDFEVLSTVPETGEVGNELLGDVHSTGPFYQSSNPTSGSSLETMGEEERSKEANTKEAERL